MISAQSVAADLLAKVVLVGPPGAGKASILKAMAEYYAHSSVRAGEVGEGKVFRTEFFWPHALADGGRLRVRLFALSGEPVYHAVGQLLMAKADGLIFVANLARAEGDAVRGALHAMVLNAQRNSLDLSSLPAALHYHRAGAGVLRTPVFSPEEMDQWLGIPPGAVPRFVTEPENSGTLRASVEWIVNRIANQVRSEVQPRFRERAIG